MRILIFLLAHLMASIGVYAQNLVIIDSLQSSLKTEKIDSLRAIFHFELNKQWAEYNFDSAMFHAKQGADIAERIDKPVLIARGINAKGLAFDYQNQFDSALHYYRESQKYAGQNSDDKGYARATLNMAGVNLLTGKLEDALKFYEEAKVIYTRREMILDLGKVHNNQALIHRRMKNYEMAKESLKLAISNYDAVGAHHRKVNSLINIAGVYSNLEQYDSAVITGKSAMSFAKEAQDLGVYLIATISVGETYAGLSELDSAFKYYSVAEQYLTEQSSFSSKAYTYLGMASYYLKAEQWEKAKSYLDKLGDLNNLDQQVDIALNYYQGLATYHRIKRNWKDAYEAKSKAIEFKELYLDEKVAERTEELEQLFKKEQRELEIDKLQAQNKADKLLIEKKNQQTTGLIIISMLVGIVCIVLLVFYRQRKRSHQLEQALMIEEIDNLRHKISHIISEVTLEAIEVDMEKISRITLNELTERELDILRLAITNKSNAEIADEVHLSVNTVKYHLKNIYNKLGVSSKLEAREALSQAK